jgi:putative flavoprotein involved in K+ transport
VTQSVDQKASAAASAANEWLTAFQEALTARDAAAAAALFADESYWRDIVSFTWNITTVEGGAGVADLLRATLDDVDPVGFRVTEEPAEEDGVITAWIAFETKAGRGSGLLRLVDGKAFTLLTTLDELKGHEEPTNDRRPNGVRHGAFRDRVTWAESRAREATELGCIVQPEVLIVGGGQGGIALGARLRQLGVPAIIVERNERPGDSWRKRYKSLALHDPVWYDHLPYIPFPANWPVFSPKDKIGDWLEMYALVMELNYWGSTACKSAVREGDEWAVVVDRDGEEITLRPRREKFRGDQHHSSAHPGPDKYKGKKAVVIGSNNSAHDICAALWEAGADVTMVQRSSTHVVRSDSLMDLGLSDLYSERAVAAGMTTFKADTIFASLPFRILHTLQIPVYNAIRERDAEWSRPASSSTSARTTRACSSSTCAAGPATTSTSVPPSSSRTATSSWPRDRWSS